MELYSYQNCYSMLEEIRIDLNEADEKICQGLEKGVFDNSDIERKINISQRYIFNILFSRFPDLFLTSSSVTGTAGIYTLPTMYKLSHIINSKGDKINAISVQIKKKTDTSGSDYLYWRSANTIVRDGGGSDAMTFYYYKLPPDMTQGQSTGGSATSVTLGTNAKKIADYYNNVIIENVTDNWSDTITDYSALRVATIATRCSAGKYYGTVSTLPEAFHSLVSKRAVLILKNTTVSPQRADMGEIAQFNEDLRETIRGFAGTNDTNVADLFYEFRPFCG
jgi:hypothetical protein